MNQIPNLIGRYRESGVLVDTNILLLYFVGAFDRTQVSRFKRTQKFAEEDHEILERFLGNFKKIVTTPNILTEVSNLAGQLGEPAKRSCFEILAQGITLLDEHYIQSKTVAKMGEFAGFGLTDSGIIHVSRGRFLVLTDEWKLAQYLENLGVHVLNFNHIRVLGWT